MGEEKASQATPEHLKILVTGAAGFIGSRLVNHYAEKGHTVFGIDNYSHAGEFEIDSRVRMFAADVVCPKRQVRGIFEKIRPDVVNHQAGLIDPRKSMEDPDLYVRDNLVGTINLVDTMRTVCSKLIFASSCAVYGECGEMDETNVGCVPTSPYGITKKAAEEYIQLRSMQGGLSTVVLRYPNIYGPGQDGGRSTGLMAIAARQAGLGLPITIYGDGTAEYQWLHMDDLLRAHDCSIEWLYQHQESGGCLVTNLASYAMTVDEIVKMIAGRNPKIAYAAPRLGEQRKITMTGYRARSELGWTPSIEPEVGAIDMMEIVEE